MGAGRVRSCVACGIDDDHPRHVTATPAGPVFVHMDCHARMGCETCKQQIADAGGAKGDQLRSHLIALGEASHG